MSVHYNPPSVTHGLILHLDATNPRSYPGAGTTWFDMSGNRNHGTLTNMSVPSCHVRTYGGRALDFDGSNDYVRCGPRYLDAPLSMHVWFYPTQLGSLMMVCGNSDELFPFPQNYLIYLDNSTIKANMKLGGSFISLNGGTAVLNTWIHALMVKTSTAFLLYVNGVLADSTANSSLVDLSANQQFVIGAQNLGSSATRFFKGLIDDVRIYNRALTPSEILQNFNATRGRFGV